MTLPDFVRKRAGQAGRNGRPKPAGRRPAPPAAEAADPPRRRQAPMLAPYAPFPVAALPDPIRPFVAEGAAAIGCDPAFLALPALSAAAGLIGNTRVVAPRRTWREPCVVWTCTVADSGTLKSPSFHAALAPLFAIQKRLHQDYKQAADRHAAQRQRQRQSDEAPGESEGAPRQRRVVCSDITVERLVEILDDNPRGTLVARDELAGWLGSFTRYKGKSGGSDLPLWLEAHRAGLWVVDRKTGERRSLFVPHAAVSVCGTIQPGTLARVLSAEHLDTGLAARVLFAMPPKMAKRWSELEVSPETEEEYRGLLERLHQLDFAEVGAGENRPHVLTFDPAAKALWVAFYESFAQEQAAAQDERAAALSKLEGYAARLALLHHVVTHVGLDSDDRRPVTKASVEAGIGLCRWFAGEAERVYALLFEGDDARELRRLVDWIRSRGRVVSAKELQRSSRRYTTAEHADAALDALVSAGLGAWEDRPTTARGGRPSRVFRLFTVRADETDETEPAPDGMGDAYEGGADETPDGRRRNP